MIGTQPPKQVQGAGSQRGHHAGTVASVAVGVLIELVVLDLVPALDAPALVAELLVSCSGWKEKGGRHLHYPADADPVLAGVPRSLFYSQHAGDITIMADLLIRTTKGIVRFPWNWLEI